MLNKGHFYAWKVIVLVPVAAATLCF